MASRSLQCVRLAVNLQPLVFHKSRSLRIVDSNGSLMFQNGAPGRDSYIREKAYCSHLSL